MCVAEVLPTREASVIEIGDGLITACVTASVFTLPPIGGRFRCLAFELKNARFLDGLRSGIQFEQSLDIRMVQQVSDEVVIAEEWLQLRVGLIDWKTHNLVSVEYPHQSVVATASARADLVQFEFFVRAGRQL